MLGLSIGLWIEHATELQSGSHNGKQQLPESGRKARVLIMDNLVWYTKELYYMCKKQLGCLAYYLGPFPHKTWDQTSKLGKLLNIHHESMEATM